VRTARSSSFSDAGADPCAASAVSHGVFDVQATEVRDEREKGTALVISEGAMMARSGKFRGGEALIHNLDPGDCFGAHPGDQNGHMGA
jgi:hypothetical protein